MLALNLPSFELKSRIRSGKSEIFDFIRRKYVALTPEEWVRQHFVHYMVEVLGYPQELMANEVQLNLNGTSRRCDTVFYDTGLKPRLIVEYKAADIQITQKVFDQIMRYNMVLHVDFLIVSNGMEHYCCRMDYANDRAIFQPAIPTYEQLIAMQG